MRYRLMAAATIAALFLAGCDRMPGPYQVVRAGNQTFLLNSADGHVSIIDGNSILPTSAPPPQSAATAVKSWPTRSLPQVGNVTISTRTVYRDGAMRYIVVATPFTPEVEREDKKLYTAARFNLSFDDANGFLLTSLSAGIQAGENGPTRIVDNKGAPFALQWRGTIAMSRDTYDSLDSMSVGWSGFAASTPPPPTQ